jgi:nicotinate phosphoribosyltransferase
MTDLYELTMLQAYWREKMFDTAVFSLFAWRLPRQRNYLLACGLADVLDYLENLHFDKEAIAYLRSLGQFGDDFLDWLKDFRFTGNVYAMAEGTPFFALEPVLEIEAPMPQAQLVETFVMNQIHLQTVLASKAARVMRAAGGRPVWDFGLRRSHGLDAGLKGARAFHIAGLSGTSNVRAGQLYDIPVSGTLAHSYIQAHASEKEALRSFAACYPETVLLVDTYDPLAGVDMVVSMAREMGEHFRIRAIRLDSGDLRDLSRAARAKLDQAGLDRVGIVVSGGLDEYSIQELVAPHTIHACSQVPHIAPPTAPIDGFGVGSRMTVSADAPGIDFSYKLAAYAGQGRIKNAANKQSYPGRKQVYRMDETGTAHGDVVAWAHETCQGRPLLQQVMADGRVIEDKVRDHHQARRLFAREQDRLPSDVRSLSQDIHYPVTVSHALEKARQEILRQTQV